MQIGDYTLANADKIDRAVNGTVLDKGLLKGGVGADAEGKLILAEYDRLGGLILFQGKYKVKTGSFWDLKAQKPIAKPKPVLVFNVGGEVVEVPADEPLPLEVRASEQVKEKKAKKVKAVADKKAASKGKGKGKKAAAPVDDEDEEADADDTDGDDEEDGEAA